MTDPIITQAGASIYEEFGREPTPQPERDVLTVGSVTYHRDLIQGSDEWLQQRCGLLTASEMKLIVATDGGGTVTKYQPSGRLLSRPTPLRMSAIDALGGKVGVVRELAFAAGVSDGLIRELIKDGALESVVTEVPRTYRAASDDKERAHVFELLGQRLTGHVEARYVSDDMLRGRDDEIEARIQYAKHFAPVTDVGFVTNDKWGFTIGYSPDGLVGDDGQIECKSRRHKFQVETIATGEVPDEFMLQLQTGLLVTERKWIDFVSYSGGLPMFVKRVLPDEEIQTAIVTAATAFEARVEQRARDYHDAIASMVKFIPTERRIEQEMFV